MKPIILKYGLIAGAILAIFMIASLPFMREWMQQGHLEKVTIASFAVALSTVFFGIQAYYQNERVKPSFGKSLLVGILITLLAAAINSATWEVCYQTTFQDFPERFVERNMQRLKEAGKTDEEIEVEILSAKEMMDSYKRNLPFRLFLSFTEIIPMGVVFSLISTTVLRLRQKRSHHR